MPEGDTIHRIASQLSAQLVGQRLVRVTTQGLERGVTGSTVTAVDAHGKHLVITLDSGTTLRTHLGLHGRHRSFERAEGERALARMSPGRVSLALHTAAHVHVWIGARTVEITDRRAPRFGQAIAALGPDVLDEAFDPRDAARRAAEHATRRIADVLLDQRVAAGVGNVYKCEVLFLRGLDPRTEVRRLSVETLEAMFATCRELMLENLGPGMRSTRDRLAGDAPSDDRFFVYGRTGKPCRRCGSAICCFSLGEPPRWTWACVVCQPPSE